MPGLQAWSAALFVAGGVFWMFIGLLTPILKDSGVGGAALLFTDRSDTGLFGEPPSEIRATQSAVVPLRAILLDILGGLLLVAGAMVVALGWFGWRAGHLWAFATLAAVAVVCVPYWVLAIRPYLRAGAPLGLADIPPFMWVTTALWLPAIVLGVLSLRADPA